MTDNTQLPYDDDATDKPDQRKTRTPFNEDTEATRKRQTRSLDKAPGTGHVHARTPDEATATSGQQAPIGYSKRPPRRGRARQRRDQRGALYLPWWSIAVMLVAVFVVSGGLVGIVYLLGNTGTIGAEPTPIIRIVTAAPTRFVPPEQAVQQPTSVAPATVVIAGGEVPDQLALAGPTLEPIVFTPTPAAVRVGGQILVEGVDEQMLNVRDRPTIRDSSVLFRADEGARFDVVAGPEQADGFTWWRIQDPTNSGRSGWAVSNYLQAQGE